MNITQTTKTKSKNPSRKRIWELDFLRFIAIWTMFIGHYHYSVILAGNLINIGTASPLYDFYLASYNYWGTSALYNASRVIIVLFPLLCGITTSFCSDIKAAKKGAKYLLIAYIITLATYILSIALDYPSVVITFGVIHCLSVSMLIYGAVLAIITRLIKLKNRYAISACVLAVGVFIIILGSIASLSDNESFKYIGLAAYSDSADYYPLIPWTGWVLLGAAIGLLLYPTRKSLAPKVGNLLEKPLYPFVTLGKYSIQFYLIHQAALFGIFYVIFSLFA